MEISPGITAFVTGGAQGIGLGIARALARQGLTVALTDIDAAALARASAELAAVTEVATFELDVRDRAAFTVVADEAERRLGPVRVLVNNAGVGVGVMQTISEEISYPIWDHVVGINLEGVNNGVTTFLPRLLDRGDPAHIVNTASAAGLVVFPERSSGYTYHASKYAVVGLTEALRRGLRDEGRPIGASVLLPGLVATSVAANSLNAAPDTVLAPTARERMRPIATAGDAALAAHGRDIDSVGHLVVEAVRADELYIPTDRLAAGALTRRTEALLASMPAGRSPYDDALGTAMRDRRSSSSTGE
ncbi:SDR family NAD(P)-dependent oxidoreductase [Nonomuraea diastatica]|uniref:SDR family NAD(P)-dependent oxidoreductase n=1 Tax=Nonomuraea diastatica TaxID=1848329 RepID=A0A4R4WXT9_9ACTN|nr:SDR family NAD(P)-dependent oxidoreductase [Nonomuraea diastatica]TDD22673.1 SDR family NAD(P)-dependent oxidoreductase [Nonomuraea diastatica]